MLGILYMEESFLFMNVILLNCLIVNYVLSKTEVQEEQCMTVESLRELLKGQGFAINRLINIDKVV